MGRRAGLVMAIALWAGQAWAAPSAVIADPDAWLKSFYSRPINEDPPRAVLTPRLRSAWAAEEKDANGEVGRLDFSPFLDGQDSEIKGAKVKGTPGPHAADQRIVTVDFVNGHPVKLIYYFERGPRGWLIDEIQKVGADGWTLSVLLKYGWAP